MQSSYLGEDIEKLLGREFLTWLWFKSEQHPEFFVDNKPHWITTEKRITVSFGEGANAETASAGGPASQLLEAKLGLAEGKTVVRATYRVENEHMGWTFSIKASDFSLSSIKPPSLNTKGKEEGDEEAILLERISYIEDFLTIFEVLYAMFLELRLGVQWNEEVKGMQAWIKGSLSH